MQLVSQPSPYGCAIGRYAMYGQIAVGNMGTVYFGRLRGQRGFSRTVAIKRLHPRHVSNPDFVAMVLAEAALAARVKHPNVVAPLDVVALEDNELMLVMEYIHGEPLSRLLSTCHRSGTRIPVAVAVSVVADSLYGLHAAHEAVSEGGAPLHIVHRDVSPANILIGVDGLARVLDFGVGKSSLRTNATRAGNTHGKLAYMAPEQFRASAVDRRADVFSAGVVLWEMLTLHKLFDGEGYGQIAGQILWRTIPAPSAINPDVPQNVDAVVARALANSPDERFTTARDFALALEQATAAAPAPRVGQWVAQTAGARLVDRAEEVALIERAALAEAAAPEAPVVRTPAASAPAIAAAKARLPRPTALQWLGLAAGAAVLVVSVIVGSLARGNVAAGSGTPASRSAGLAARPPAPAPHPPAPEEPAAEKASVAAEPARTEAARADPPAPRPAAVRKSARHGRGRHALAERRTRRHALGAVRPDCDPPYFLDPTGIRRIKRECLR
jgi:eukaryotic-like serine/threonine-protein kinase